MYFGSLREFINLFLEAEVAYSWLDLERIISTLAVVSYCINQAFEKISTFEVTLICTNKPCI